jgi:hypothetical protein
MPDSSSEATKDPSQIQMKKLGFVETIKNILAKDGIG